MSDVEQFFGRIFARVRVAFTSLGKDSLPLANTTGLALGKIAGQTETSHGEPMHGIPGVLSRPKAPAADGTTATGFAVRFGDHVVPIALVDRRIAKAFTDGGGELPAGAAALAGYEGQRVLVEPGTFGSAKIEIAAPSGERLLAIVLDNGAGFIVITGETRVTVTPGGESGAQPVLIAPDLSTISALVAAVNALGAYVNGIAPGTVPGVPIVSTIAASAALKATPT